MSALSRLWPAFFSLFISLLAMAVDPSEDPLANLRKYGLDLTALEQEIVFEQAQLPIEERVNMEAQKLMERIREAVLQIYHAELALGRSELEIHDLIEGKIANDLKYLDPLMRDEVRDIVSEFLVDPWYNSTTPIFSERFKGRLRENIKSRLRIIAEKVHAEKGTVLKSQTLEKNTTRKALLHSLVSDQYLSERWVATSNIVASSGSIKGHAEEFSAQVAVEFLGVKLAAGPTFRFKKSSSTKVEIKGEGLEPLFDQQGKFNYLIDQSGEPRMRFISFSCEVDTQVESEVLVKGGFKAVGVGGEAEVTTKYVNNISLSSRRALVPESIDGRTVTVSVLAELCQHDFLETQTSDGHTVKENIDDMLRNLIAGLVFVNPAMKCLTDNHCFNWYNKELLGIHKFRTYPRCLAEKGNPQVMSCQLRGLEGANCQVAKDGKIVSSGMFEYPCDHDMKCVVTKEGGWGGFLNLRWTPWVGTCQPRYFTVILE